jgi:hypothetical protein
VPGTEVNPEFLEQVAAAVPKRSGGCLLVCNIGGSLDPTGALLRCCGAGRRVACIVLRCH